MRRERDHAIATPLSLVTRLARATAVAEVRWLEAKQESNFALFAPHLEEVVALTRDKAQVLSQALGLSPYDSLIDGFSPGFLSAEIDQLFRVVSRRLPNLIREVIELQATRPPLPLLGKVGASKQRTLAVEVMRALGFPFDRGRLDESDHPFTEGVNGDVRVTTRFDLKEPFTGLMGVLHETGQAMYDLGLPEAWRDQPVGRDRGMALEESQSLLLEMIIGRSRPFLTYLRPLLEKHFGVTGPEWEVENLYQTLIRVRRGAIRVDADELTYPVHIMLRYELEKRIFDGTLPVRDLPEAWRDGLTGASGCAPRATPRGACRIITGRSGRSATSLPMRSAGSSRPSCTRRCATIIRTSTGRSRPAGSAACSSGCARTCTASGCQPELAGTDQEGDGQGPDGGAMAPLRESKYLEQGG